MLSKENIVGVTVLAAVSALFLKRNAIRNLFKKVHAYKNFKLDIFSFVLILCLILQALVNLIGALGPELAFDALWYHLTFPKLYLENQAITYLPGGLLHYSVMPKLGELFYVGALAFGNEITAKVLHWFFGILICLGIYIYTRKFFKRPIALLAVIIFYANLVVAWESTTAYIDLIRTFFEFMALCAFIVWFDAKRMKWFLLSSLMMGLAISTKLLALGSLGIVLLLIIGILIKRKVGVSKTLQYTFLYGFLSLVVPLPWFVFAYYYTGNPVYPFFTATYGVEPSPLHPLQMVGDIWNGLLFSADPLSPIYLTCIPLIGVYFMKFSPTIRLMILYSMLSLFVWYFTPRTGGGRFLLVYLPVYSIVCAALIDFLIKEKSNYSKKVAAVLTSIILFIAVTSIGYRAAANYRYIPVITGGQSKQAFLKENLNFAYGDFYDIDGYFQKTITPQDNVLLYGFHNLYYVEFPFIHSSWAKKGARFNYIAVQDGKIPERFKDWKIVYENNVTKVKLYTDDKKYYHY